MKTATRVLTFLIINFLALGLGSLFTDTGVNSDWYITMDKAPWTPPGWFFGVAWTTIMICFAFYMSSLWKRETNKKMLLTLFIIQWILNVSWNPVFFYMQQSELGLLVIILLTILINYFLFKYLKLLKNISFLIVPYALWLIIATSLNLYIVLYN